MVNPILNATAQSPTANSYATVERADSINSLNPYTEFWDLTANALPSAASYVADGAASTGASQVDIDSGSGTWSLNTVFQFNGHTTKYTVSEELVGAGTLKFTPSLTDDVTDGEVIERLTPNKKEQCLITVSSLFDKMLVYPGSPTSTTQRMRHPRTNLYNADGQAYDSAVIVEVLEEATALMANLLCERDLTAAPAALGLGVSYAQLGPLEARLDATMREEIIPDFILSLLSEIASLEPEAQVGSAQLPTYRS